MKPGQFHTHDGWLFERTENGGVKMTASNVPVHELTAEAWTSIVAHVSARGEDGATYREALDFHNREPSQ